MPNLVLESRITDEECIDCYDDGISIFDGSSTRISIDLDETDNDI